MRLTYTKIPNHGLECRNSNMEKFTSKYVTEIVFQWNLSCRFCSKGNLTNLISMTNWQGNDVLYIGDHIYGDLAVSSFIFGWRSNELNADV